MKEVSEHELDCVGQDQHQSGQHLVKEAGQHSVKESEQAENAESVTETELDFTYGMIIHLL